jgi:hypothetical protein
MLGYKPRRRMRRIRAATIVVLALLTAACAGRRAPDVQEMSGFLDDYSRLRPGGADELPFVYRNPDARWSGYRKVLVEPVTLWRSGRHSLAPIPEEALLRLVSDFELAVRRRLGDAFELVDEPAAGTLRLRLAITEARASDPVLDVLTAAADPEVRRTEGALPAELRQFIERAAIEGEIVDAQTNTLFVQGIDRRRKNAQPLETWAQLDAALDAWAYRMVGRLEARTGRR